MRPEAAYDLASQNGKRIITTYYQNMGIAFDSSDATLVDHDNHASWTYSNVFYDPTIDKAVIFYDIKPYHNVINCRLLMRTKDKEGNFSAPIVVANRNGEATPISTRSQASGRAANGDYVSLVSLIRNSDSVVLGTQVYRSSDQGSTWTNYEMLVDGQSLKAWAGDVNGFLTLKSGRILTWATLDPNRECKAIYSDDNGQTWHFGSIQGNPIYHTEPAWCELSDGTIVCLLRNMVSEPSGYTQKKAAKFIKSTTGGLTWSQPIDSTSIVDYTESNGAMIYQQDTKTIEFIHHSRFTQPDGFTSLYVSVTSESDAKNGDFGKQMRIGKLNDCGSGPQGDSGYIGACKFPDGTINAFYYNGIRTAAQICYLIGRRQPFSGTGLPLDNTTSIPLFPETSDKKDISVGSDAKKFLKGWYKDYVESGDFTSAAPVKGGYYAKRLIGATKWAAELSVSSAGESVVTLLDMTTGTVVKSGISIGQSALHPFSVPISLGSPASKFIDLNLTGMVNAGAFATTGRPTVNRVVGSMIYDTTLNKPIWWDGTNWRDAAGTVV